MKGKRDRTGPAMKQQQKEEQQPEKRESRMAEGAGRSRFLHPRFLGFIIITFSLLIASKQVFDRSYLHLTKVLYKNRCSSSLYSVTRCEIILLTIILNIIPSLSILTPLAMNENGNNALDKPGMPASPPLIGQPSLFGHAWSPLLPEASIHYWLLCSPWAGIESTIYFILIEFN